MHHLFRCFLPFLRSVYLTSHVKSDAWFVFPCFLPFHPPITEKPRERGGETEQSATRGAFARPARKAEMRRPRPFRTRTRESVGGNKE